jgi:hypothetical protein
MPESTYEGSRFRVQRFKVQGSALRLARKAAGLIE